MSHTTRAASSRTLTRLALGACLLASASMTRPQASEAAMSASDSLFAPAVAQQEARLARIAGAGSGALSPEQVFDLLEAGRPNEAAAALARLTGEPRAMARARLRVALTRLDFAAAKPLAQSMGALRDASESERSLYLAYLSAIDDAARIDAITRRDAITPGTDAPLAHLLAAGRLASTLLNYDRAESCFTRVIEATEAAYDSGYARSGRAAALRGLGGVLSQHRDYDGSLARLRESMELEVGPDLLNTLTETLIRLGRTDDAITASEWAVRLNPYSEGAHYTLGNGYARKNYTELFAAHPTKFADTAGRQQFAHADSLLAGGDRRGARTAYEAIVHAHPEWADAAVRLASFEFEEGRFAQVRDLSFAALAQCPDYGRAHATLAKAFEGQRFTVDVHRADYEKRFAATAMPSVAGIERFVVNWNSLSPRHRKRVALSVAPWARYLPVLIEGGSTYYIKPLYMLLCETPGLETIKDTRISYDSRLWDDVRGAGGYNTVTGIEDVERTIFDRYNTVLHELTHQIHRVLTADQSRDIQEHYRLAKQRDDVSKNGYLSRYAGGSVFEYFAEGANALYSPRRDAYDTRDVVRERLDAIDPALRDLVERMIAVRDVSPSYAVAYTNAGDDRVERGEVDAAVAFYDKALARDPRVETALSSSTRARIYKGDRPAMLEAAHRALEAHPGAGDIITIAASAQWYGGMGLDSAIAVLEAGRAKVNAADRYLMQTALGGLYWMRGDAGKSGVQYDSVLAYQSDNPEALWGRAQSLALANDWDAAFAMYERAVRMRTGIPQLRCDYARDLLRAGKLADARAQLDAAALLDPQFPTTEALRGWWWLDSGNADSASVCVQRALGWGEWSDLARIVQGMIETRRGNSAAAEAAWAPLRARIAGNAPPEYVFRKDLSAWQSVHELPAVERALMGIAAPNGVQRP